MTLRFSDNFKKEIQELGNAVLLKEATLLGGLRDEGTFIEFQSLWNEETKTLSITLDLSEISADQVEGVNVIQVYYSDLSGERIGEAFQLRSPNDLLLCHKKRDPANYDEPVTYLTRDLNHITVYFPSTTVADIKTVLSDDNTKFLEKYAGMHGVNTFLAREGRYEETDYLTKDSYEAYIRDRISLTNSIPLYLDKNGEKVTSISTYKHYKKIEIHSEGDTPQTTSGSKTKYTINNGGTANIVGTVFYDLYSVSNGVYTLERENLRMDLSPTTLVQLDMATGTPLEETTSAITIDPFQKAITFDSDQTSEINDFACLLTFTPEINDDNSGMIAGNSFTIKSNVVEFVTYLRWNVEYGSSLYEDGVVVLVFDSPRGSGLWNFEEDEDSRENCITVFSESNIDPQMDIVITPEDPDRFNSYFEIILPQEGVFESSNKRWRYDIKIVTTQDNLTDKWWYPLGPDGKGTMVLSRITVNSGTKNAASDIRFYCVQRPTWPLVIAGSSDQTSETFSTGIGPKEVKFYLDRPIDNYTTWEVDMSGLDSDLLITSQTHDLVDYDSGTVVSPTSAISAKTMVYAAHSEEVNLGSVTFRRRNRAGAADFSYWKDLIYCHPVNDITIEFFIDRLDFEAESVTADPDRVNYPDVPGVPTKYYYPVEDTYKRLYIFNPGETKSFILNTATTTGLNVNMSVDFQSIFEQFFTTSVTKKTEGSFKVEITAKPRNPEYDQASWWPKNTEGKPIELFIGNETFYCVVRPNLPELMFYIPEGDSYKVVSEVEMTSEKNQIEGPNNTIAHRQIVYVVSNVLSSEFPGWTVFSKDNEMEVYSVNPSDNTGSSMSGTVLDSNIDNWPNKGQQYTMLTTNTLPYDVTTVKFDDLVVRRTAGTGFVDEIDGLFEDWRNQLVDNTYSLGLSLAPTGKSDKITVQYLTSGGNREDYIEGLPLELDYIGLYRIYVKSETGFRVSLPSSNKRDGFYFFNSSGNEIKWDVLTLDEGSFDTVTGREVCFAFIGNEPGTFSSKDQTLETTIRITSFDDRSSVIIPLHRKYFNQQSSGGVLSNQVLDTNITSTTTQDEIVFIKPGVPGQLDFQFVSNLETITEYIPIAEDATTKITISHPKGNPYFDYGSYLAKSTVKRGTKITSIDSRGYIRSDSSVSYTPGSTLGKSYPISPMGLVRVKNPGDLYQANNESISVTLYQLIDAPKITTNYETEGRVVALTNRTGNSKMLYVKAENTIYNICYTVGNSGTYVVVERDSVGYAEFNVADSTGTNQVSVVRMASEDSDLGEAWKITSLCDYPAETEDMVFGGLRFITYVPKGGFLLDENGERVLTYDQPTVDLLVGTNKTDISLKRLSKKNSESSIEGGNQEQPISRYGETREYTISLSDPEATIDVNEYRNSWKDYINSITCSGLSLTVDYKNRLTRFGVNYSGTYYSSFGSSRLSYTRKSIDGEYKYIISDTALLNKMVSIANGNIDSNFSIQVGGKQVTTTGITQDPWEYGIMVDGYLFAGGNNGRYSESLDFEGGSISFYACKVKFPKNKSNNGTENSNVVPLSDPLTVRVTRADTSDYALQATGAFINRIESNGNAYSTGTPYAFSKNSQGGNSTLTYTIDISDDYGNRVFFNITQAPKDTFEVYLYSRYDEENHKCWETDKLKGIIFNTQGTLYTDDNNSVYMLTDYGVNGESGSSPDFFNSSYSSYVRDEGGASISGSYNFNENITYRLIYSSGVTREGDTTEYALYELTPFSKLSRATNYSSSGGPARMPGHIRFIRDVQIGINYNSYATVTAYYGSSTLQLVDPVVTYVSVREKEDDEGHGTGEYYPPHYIINFFENDNIEFNKYTANGSYLMSDTKPNSGTSTVPVDGGIHISYAEFSSTPVSSLKFSRYFNPYGYFEGWGLEFSRYEWEYDLNHNPTATYECWFRKEGNDGHKIIRVKSAYGANVEYITDEADLQNAEYYPESTASIDIMISPYTESSNFLVDDGYYPALSLVLGKSLFTSNGNNHVLKNNILVDIETEDRGTVSFYVTAVLNLTTVSST